MITVQDSRVVITKPIVLIGMMGAGKTSVGKRLAGLLRLPFVDSDQEIEKSAGMSVSDIFTKLGEPEFRAMEQKVILRLLGDGAVVLSIGGGAFMNEATRAAIKRDALSIWLTADEAVLLERATRHGTRPLLQGDDAADKMKKLLDMRNPVYAEADVHFTSDNRPVDVTAQRLHEVVVKYLENNK